MGIIRKVFILLILASIPLHEVIAEPGYFSIRERKAPVSYAQARASLRDLRKKPFEDPAVVQGAYLGGSKADDSDPVPRSLREYREKKSREAMERERQLALEKIEFRRTVENAMEQILAFEPIRRVNESRERGNETWEGNLPPQSAQERLLSNFRDPMDSPMDEAPAQVRASLDANPVTIREPNRRIDPRDELYPHDKTLRENLTPEKYLEDKFNRKPRKDRDSGQPYSHNKEFEDHPRNRNDRDEAPAHYGWENGNNLLILPIR